LWGGQHIRDALASFIGRTQSAKGLGFEVSAAAPQPKPESPADRALDKERVAEVGGTDRQAIEQQLAQLRERLQGSESEKTEIIAAASRLLEEKERESRYWFFEFLDQFLVLRTKYVLWWFVNQPPSTPITLEIYNGYWMSFIPDESQREIILSVLLNFGLVQQDGAFLQPTEKGRMFNQY